MRRKTQDIDLAQRRLVLSVVFTVRGGRAERRMKMHAHIDKPCGHDLKECTECGNVYCYKCNKEWYKNQGVTYSTYPYTTTGGVFYSEPFPPTTTAHFHTQAEP